jgi:hypothetical protein
MPGKTIESLPTEVLLEVCSYLSPLALEFLARTYVKHLTPVCLMMPTLRYCIQETRNVAMIIRDVRPSSIPYIWHIMPNTDVSMHRDWLDMEGVFGPYSTLCMSSKRPFANLEHLGLCGELGWLQDLDKT